jgi:hypothetical protein
MEESCQERRIREAMEAMETDTASSGQEQRERLSLAFAVPSLLVLHAS